MAERKQSGKAAEDEEVPAFFKNLGSGSPKPRQKFCGMFCPVEGSSENKTIDFDSLSVGRGSGQVVAQQRDVAHLGPDPQPPYSRQGRRAGGEPSVESGRKVAIRRASGKEALQNVYDQRALHRTFSRSRPELEARTMVSGSRTASENLVTLIPVRKVRRTREAMESPEETLTLLNSPYAEQSSAKSLSKGYPEPPPPPPALFRRRFAESTLGYSEVRLMTTCEGLEPLGTESRRSALLAKSPLPVPWGPSASSFLLGIPSIASHSFARTSYSTKEMRSRASRPKELPGPSPSSKQPA